MKMPAKQKLTSLPAGEPWPEYEPEGNGTSAAAKSGAAKIAAKLDGKKPRKARTRTKQQHLDGMAPPTIPEIETAAVNYEETRNERQQLTEEEVDLKGKLLELMHKHQLKEYRFDNRLV